MRRDVLFLRLSLLVFVAVLGFCFARSRRSPAGASTTTLKPLSSGSVSRSADGASSADDVYTPMSVTDRMSPTKGSVHFGAPGTSLAAEAGLDGFVKERQYAVIDAEPVEMRGQTVRYRHDDDSLPPIRCGNLLSITWSEPLQAHERFRVGQLHVNYFIEDDCVPVNPPMPFESNNPYFVVESFARDKGHHKVLVISQVDGGRYDWTRTFERERQLGVVEEQQYVLGGEGRAPLRVETSIRFLTAMPGGEEFAFLRNDESGHIVERRGAPLPAFSNGDPRYADYVRFLLEWRRHR